MYSFKKQLIFILFISLMFAINLPAFSQENQSYQNEPNGFRNLTWGTNFSQVKDQFSYYRIDLAYGGIDLYRRNGDDLHIGQSKLDFILYGFWKGKLSDVRIMSKGYENWNNLKAAVFNQFGQVPRLYPFDYLEEYIWNGPITTIILSYNRTLEEAMLILFSTSTSEEQIQYRDQKLQEGGQSDF